MNSRACPGGAHGVRGYTHTHTHTHTHTCTHMPLMCVETYKNKEMEGGEFELESEGQGGVPSKGG